MQNSEQHIKQIEQLVIKEPSNHLYCQKLAKAYAKEKHWKEVSFAYQQLYLKENNLSKLIANAFFNAAYHAKQQTKYNESINLYRIALDYGIDDSEEVYVNLAVIYSENLRKENLAVIELEKALEVNINYCPALFNLAGLYEEIGNKPKAIYYYKKLLTLIPLAVNALVRLAACLTGEESFKLINPIKKSLAENSLSNDERISLNYALGKLLDDSKNYAEAFEAYEKANILESCSYSNYSLQDQTNLTNQDIDFFTQEWFKSLPVISTARPIFICGMFRSGSTLLEQIISTYDEITAGGEIDFFSRLNRENKIAYPHVMKKAPLDSLKSIAKRYLAELRTLFNNDYMVIDKRPDNFLYIGIIKALFPNAEIIYTNREPLDNCLAIYFQRLDQRLNYSTNIEFIGHFYKQQQRLVKHWKSVFPDTFHVINYESLVLDPKKETADLLSKLGLEWQISCMNFYKNKNNVKTASIWQIRQPLHKKSCGRWKNYEEQLLPLKQMLNTGN